jgi:hypothetical protein
MVRGRINFEYVVIFTDRNSKFLGVSIGSCWEEDISDCTKTVLSEASQAWRNRKVPND